MKVTTLIDWMLPSFIGLLAGVLIGGWASDHGTQLKIDKAVAAITNGYEDNRVLVCTGPTVAGGQLAALAPHIKFNGKYFEILNDQGQHFVYVPSAFDSCRTVPVPPKDDRSAQLSPYLNGSTSGEGSTLSSQ